MMRRDRYLGVDLGGTKILAGVVTPAGRILSRAKSETPFRARAEALVAALAGTMREALASARTGPERLIAIGIGSPGPLDPRRGVVLRTPNIAIRNFPVGRLLAKEFGAPVVLDNDVHMAVFGELKVGAARGHEDVIGIWVGTGVGGCVIRGGSVLQGVNRNAGEIGHMILDARKAKAGSKKGTLEWEASKTGLLRRLRKEIRDGKKTALARHVPRRGGRLNSGVLAKAFRKGDGVAKVAVDHSARYVGIAVANLFDALAPGLFVLGGGVVEALGDSYVKLVRKSAQEHAFTTELGPIRIEASRLGDDAGMLGAALAARERHPARAGS